MGLPRPTLGFKLIYQISRSFENLLFQISGMVTGRGKLRVFKQLRGVGWIIFPNHGCIRIHLNSQILYSHLSLTPILVSHEFFHQFWKLFCEPFRVHGIGLAQQSVSSVLKSWGCKVSPPNPHWTAQAGAFGSRHQSNPSTWRRGKRQGLGVCRKAQEQTKLVKCFFKI